MQRGERCHHVRKNGSTQNAAAAYISVVALRRASSCSKFGCPAADGFACCRNSSATLHCSACAIKAGAHALCLAPLTAGQPAAHADVHISAAMNLTGARTNSTLVATCALSGVCISRQPTASVTFMPAAEWDGALANITRGQLHPSLSL